MLRYWSDEFTDAVVLSPRTRTGSPVGQLYSTIEMIEEQHLAKYDLAIRAWAEHDATARRAVRNVYRRRIEFVSQLFHELGFRGQELELRVQLFVCYHSWQQTIFLKATPVKRRSLRRLRCQRLP